MNITIVPPDLVDTEFGNPNNHGSIYLTIVRNYSDPEEFLSYVSGCRRDSVPMIKRSINELIVTNDVISFKFFTAGIIFPDVSGVENDIILQDKYDPATHEQSVYKLNFDREDIEMMKLIQSFVLFEVKK